VRLRNKEPQSADHKASEQVILTNYFYTQLFKHYITVFQINEYFSTTYISCHNFLCTSTFLHDKVF